MTEVHSSVGAKGDMTVYFPKEVLDALVDRLALTEINSRGFERYQVGVKVERDGTLFLVSPTFDANGGTRIISPYAYSDGWYHVQVSAHVMSQNRVKVGLGWPKRSVEFGFELDTFKVSPLPVDQRTGSRIQYVRSDKGRPREPAPIPKVAPREPGKLRVLVEMADGSMIAAKGFSDATVMMMVAGWQADPNIEVEVTE